MTASFPQPPRQTKKRLSDLLLRLMEAHGEQVGDRMHMQLPLSRTDLADLIGVQPETMSRLFKRLKDEGTFVVSGRDIQMPLTHSSHLPSDRPGE
ncbi:MAG TPA: helix-turn-helix domain-containing protein [Roseovarius sp.]